jgi:CheY-like chemotaxis protein
VLNPFKIRASARGAPASFIARSHVVLIGPILVVDDDVDIREILAETLEDLGFSAVTASNGLEATRLLRSMTVLPSLILLDLMMPVMDGYGFLEVREKDPVLSTIPVAIITAGHGVDPDRLGNGTRIIRKPIDLPLLVNVIRDLSSEARRPR